MSLPHDNGSTAIPIARTDTNCLWCRYDVPCCEHGSSKMDIPPMNLLLKYMPIGGEQIYEYPVLLDTVEDAAQIAWTIGRKGDFLFELSDPFEDVLILFEANRVIPYYPFDPKGRRF